MTDIPTAAEAADTPTSTDPNSTDPGSEHDVQRQLVNAMFELNTNVAELIRQQGLHGQLLLAQAHVMKDVRALLDQFGPLLDQWASSPKAKVAAALGGLRRAGGQ